MIEGQQELSHKFVIFHFHKEGTGETTNKEKIKRKKALVNENSEKYPEIGGRNAGPIIDDLEPFFSIIFQGNLDASGSSVQAVLD